MGKGTIKTKAMTMAVAMSMVAGLCPSTVFAANSEVVAKVQDGTYTGTAECTPDGDGEFTKYNLSLSVTVEDGKMTIHISLVSKNIVNLFPGTAKEAQKKGTKLLEPTTDKVTYSDGTTEEVYGFDVPVPALDEEFDLALIGTKGKWYDHKVSVSNPVKAE